MNRAKMQLTEEPGGAPMVGDHLALDLLNTEANSDGAPADYWNSGADVRRWLARFGIASDAAVDLPALLVQARALRAVARTLIAQRKAGRVGDVDGLDVYLAAYASAPRLERGPDGALTLTRVPRAAPIAALLGPVAEAVARLLVDGDFDQVRQCEHPDCILWFLDRTKAHKRRWCSMALCGNRYKAAQFRKKAGALPT